MAARRLVEAINENRLITQSNPKLIQVHGANPANILLQEDTDDANDTSIVDKVSKESQPKTLKNLGATIKYKKTIKSLLSKKKRKEEYIKDGGDSGSSLPSSIQSVEVEVIVNSRSNKKLKDTKIFRTLKRIFNSCVKKQERDDSVQSGPSIPVEERLDVESYLDLDELTIIRFGDTNVNKDNEIELKEDILEVDPTGQIEGNQPAVISVRKGLGEPSPSFLTAPEDVERFQYHQDLLQKTIITKPANLFATPSQEISSSLQRVDSFSIISGDDEDDVELDAFIEKEFSACLAAKKVDNSFSISSSKNNYEHNHPSNFSALVKQKNYWDRYVFSSQINEIRLFETRTHNDSSNNRNKNSPARADIRVKNKKYDYLSLLDWDRCITPKPRRDNDSRMLIRNMRDITARQGRADHLRKLQQENRLKHCLKQNARVADNREMLQSRLENRRDNFVEREKKVRSNKENIEEKQMQRLMKERKHGDYVRQRKKYKIP